MLLAKRKPKFFYGWVMLGIAVVASMLTTPGQTAGVSLFTPSFEEALGLSRTQQTGAYGMGTFIASLVMTYVGAQMDRYGIRRVMGVVVVLFGMVCVYTGFVTGFWTLFLAFLLLRMFGQGSLSLLASNTPAMWFDKRLGVTQAVLGIGFSLAAAGMPPFALWLIETFGWRTAYPILGGIVIVVLLPLVIFLFVDRPEDIGQALDGGWVGPIDQKQPDSGRDQFTLQQAMKTPAYWVIAGMMFSVSMIVTAITFNSLFLFEELGLTREQTVTTLAAISLTTAIAQLPAGWLADVFPLRWLAFVNMVLQATSLV
ncbi:MAG: MFS transporter, partial [Chloroflexota bacterium]